MKVVAELRREAERKTGAVKKSILNFPQKRHDLVVDNGKLEGRCGLGSVRARAAEELSQDRAGQGHNE